MTAQALRTFAPYQNTEVLGSRVAAEACPVVSRVEVAAHRCNVIVAMARKSVASAMCNPMNARPTVIASALRMADAVSKTPSVGISAACAV